MTLTWLLPDFCKRLTDWDDIIRKTFYDGGIEEVISTRRLVHVIQLYSIFADKKKGLRSVLIVSMMRPSLRSWNCMTKLMLTSNLTKRRKSDILMTNSWSLLYDELNMSNQDFWIDDGISLTGNPTYA